MKSSAHRRILYLAYAGVIAGLYVALTALSAAFGLAGNNIVQLRLAEALTVLPVFTPAAVPGLAVGCLLSNVMIGAAWPDLVFGTLATVLGAIGTALLRKHPITAPVPPIFFNTLIVPFVIRYAYVGDDTALSFLFVTVGAGEILSAGVLGYILLFALRKYAHCIFPETIGYLPHH